MRARGSPHDAVLCRSPTITSSLLLVRCSLSITDFSETADIISRCYTDAIERATAVRQEKSVILGPRSGHDSRGCATDQRISIASPRL